ncbi:hypothetical protein [Tropicimonas aquimaris]|uniref:Uncharacterized protein n=1 Tax=Tropicimonas aquimaris TaxID=914152 RepID=A0ABW3IY57_9RHOB
MLRVSVKTLLALLLVMSLLFNVATITMTGVYTAVSGALSAVGVSTVMSRQSAVLARQSAVLARQSAAATASLARANKIAEKAEEFSKKTKAITKSTTDRVKRRVVRGAARSTSSVFGEAIPVLGTAVIVGVLALEIKDACDTAQDMAGLEAALDAENDPEAARQRAVDTFSCTDLIPDADTLPSGMDVWKGMIEAPGKAWDAAAEFVVGLPDIDRSGNANKIIGWIGGLMTDVKDLFGEGSNVE